MRRLLRVLLAGVTSSAIATAGVAAKEKDKDWRASVIARAQVWEATDIPSKDMKAGPPGEKAFEFLQTVTCKYVNKKLSGKTPKFACLMEPDDELKVKYGGNNGEVHAEVAATRLLWALGFGADGQYPVKVVCRGCPQEIAGIIRSPQETVVDPAMIERKMHGAPFEHDTWGWGELDRVDERAGGAPLAQRDALKLLAVFLQSSDNKPEQQRLICRDQPKDKTKGKAEDHEQMPCEHPFMYMHDVGLTFGHANKLNQGHIGSMNLVEWSRTPVWKEKAACVGNLPKSLTGTLFDPPISEQGRQFLADLLTQLTDEQLQGMFEAARVNLRLRNPADLSSGFPTVDEWVAAFKAKRDQIVSRRCPTT
jgi:hypothetical protein